MAPPKGKQADRNSKKKKVDEDEVDAASTGVETNFADRLKLLFLGSCMLRVLPKLQGILDPKAAPAKKAEEEEKPKEENAEGEGGDGEKSAPEVSLDSAGSIFTFVKDSLVWHNCLGLATPASAEESMKAWLAMKGLELDYGPRSKKKGNPGLDRIKVNLLSMVPQYLHLLLAFMMVRSLLFRSYFACLPWLVGYQLLSLWLPLDSLKELPQVPLEKCPVQFRVAASMGIHVLMWLFFVIEFLWNIWFPEKFLYIGIICYHAYAVRPAGKDE